MTVRTGKSRLTLPFLRRRAEEEAAGLPPLLAAARQAAQTMSAGDHTRRRAGPGEKFWQFRDYHPGDRPQDIDWRQSAKGDRVFIRQKEFQTAQTALFWASGGPGMAYRSDDALPSKREAALTLSLGMALLMMQAGEQIGLLAGGMTPGRSDLAIETLGQNLLAADDAAPPNTGLHLPSHAALVLTGDFLEPVSTLEKNLEFLAARAGSGLLVQILDPAELTLPFAGRVIFEDAAGLDRHHIAQVTSIRDAYCQRINDHLESITALCRHLQFHYLLHMTDTPLRDTLSAAWQAMTPQHPGGSLS